MAGLRLLMVFAWCGALCLVLGCGEKGPQRYEVSGTATFDGAPIEKGDISFEPTDKSQAPDGGVIENGKFKFAAQAGSKLVQIRASRPLPPERQDNPEMGLLYEDYIPAQFNSSTTLKAEVTATGPNTFTFDLKSK